MDCQHAEPLGTVEYLKQFNRKVAQQRVPLSGSIELTQRCDLDCMHCYLGPRSGRGSEQQELTTAQWLPILDQATEAGCLNLLITGGEPMLRRDFAAIYRHAKQLGLLVTVFTNGTLVTEEVLEVFTDLPPRLIEITLYGATAETYEKITGVRGSYERCMAGIRRLLEADIHVGLKTILITLNRHEFFAIEQMAKSMGLKFRFDAAIFPCFNGDRTPMELRVPAREAVAKEMADEKRLKEWRDLFRRQRAIPPAETLYQCGAGIAAFHVDPLGNLRSCAMVAEPSCNLVDHSFRIGWETVIPRLHEKKATEGFQCSRCDKRALCGYCPAFFAVENGAEDAPSEYLCAMGHFRYEAIVGESSPVPREGGRDDHRKRATEETALREAEAASC